MSRKPRCRELVIGDTIYELDTAYRRGALAMRSSIPYYCNPYREGSYRHEQWNSGHCHEDEDDRPHTVDGVDVITRKRLA